MRRIELVLLVSGVLAFSACGSSGGGNKDGGGGKGGKDGGAAGSGGSTAGSGGSMAGSGGNGGSTAGMDGGAGTGAAGTTDAGDAPVDMAPNPDTKADATDGATDAVPLSAEAMRGQYLVNVLGCKGCHGNDLSGKDKFAHDNTTNGDLSSANLTNDPTGTKDDTDQALIDAFTKGIDPDKFDGGTAYLFPNMPWYQFSTLTDTDAKAIVAYLRAIPPVAHTVAAPTGVFATPLTSPPWTGNTLASLPNAVTPDGGVDGGGVDAAVASESNGKYFASLLCATCHTVNTGTTAPLMLDATKAFQGGKTTSVTLTVPIDGGVDGGDGGADAATTMMVTKSIESANLTPDPTGLSGWTQAQIITAITKATDNMSRSICGMRANASITTQDATDIANYLQAIPAVANTPTPTCY